MGARFAVPETDDTIAAAIKCFQLTKADIRGLWECFLKIDKAHTGMMNLSDLFKALHYERNGYTDSLLDLFDIDHEGEINFSDFVHFVASYCMLDEMEIMKCLYLVFDPDKLGYIFVDDCKALMNIVHNVKHPDTVYGTVRQEWKNLEFSPDGRIDWMEFLKIHNKSPMVLKPAFRLQQEMQLRFLGETFWENKKRKLYDDRVLADAIIQKKKAAKEAKKKNVKERKLKKKMGVIKYFLCPCYRRYYDVDNVADYLTDEEKLERQKRIALARRQNDLKAKNPETAPWKKYDKKVNPEKGGDKQVVVEKIEKIERRRGERQMNRQERRAERTRDPDLQHKFNTSVTHTEPY